MTTDPAAPLPSDSTPPFPPPPAGAVPVPAFAVQGAQPVPPPAPARPPRLTRRAARAQAVTTQDDKKVRRAALSVGLAVALASGAVVLLGGLVLVVALVSTAVHLPEMGPNGHIMGRPGPRYGWFGVDDFLKTIVLTAVASLIATSLVGWFMARRAIRPLAEALRLQRHFVADASHELRTPLTALSSRIQILQRRLDSGKPIDDVVAQLHNDTINMTRVLDDMLLTVEGTPLLEGTKTSVLTSINQGVASLGALAEQAKVTVTVLVPADLMVAAPPTSLTRAVVAVIDNAIQHSPAGSAVEVSAHPEARMAVIRVTDHGSGIAGVDPQQVFERFAHGTESTRKRGFGLGLALASEVTHRFGGDIQVESTSARGTTFALSFPLA